MTKHSTAITPKVTGITSEKAAAPTAPTSGISICSVAYADEEMTSEESTASAVGLPSRSTDLPLGGDGGAEEAVLQPVAEGLGKLEVGQRRRRWRHPGPGDRCRR